MATLRDRSEVRVYVVFIPLHTKITVIAEIFVRIKISYSSACRVSYAGNFRTATVVSDTLVYVYGFRMLLNFVLSAKSTKYTKLNRVWKFVRLQYVENRGRTLEAMFVRFLSQDTALQNFAFSTRWTLLVNSKQPLSKLIKVWKGYLCTWTSNIF